MSNDYISRKDALDFVCADCSDKMHRLCAVEGNCCTPYKAVKATPAADVRPVVRGKWLDGYNEDNDVRVSRCSKCGHEKPRFCKPPFCEQCGADMRPAPEPPKEEAE